MEAIVQQFFNLAIMERALPLILAGLEQTIVICLLVIPLGLIGGLAFAIISLSRSRNVFVSRRSREARLLLTSDTTRNSRISITSCGSST